VSGDVPADEGYFGERVAAVYDEHSASMFDTAVVGAAVNLLAELAGDGRVLEFAVGTGRIALPLSERGVPVAGIDNSEAMLAGCGRSRARSGSRRRSVTWRQPAWRASSRSSASSSTPSST
jgi:ubiquinone/menaquinone biosynthesis C-methylase UbiE